MAVGNVEIIGPRRITDLGNGRYMSNPTQPGIMGSGIIDEAAVKALREKYSGESVYPENPGLISPQKQLEEARKMREKIIEILNQEVDKKPEMSESEFNKKMLLYTCGGIIPMTYGLLDKDFQEAREYYTNNTETKTGKVMNVLKNVLGVGLAGVGGFLVAKNLPAIKTFAGGILSKVAGLFK